MFRDWQRSGGTIESSRTNRTSLIAFVSIAVPPGAGTGVLIESRQETPGGTVSHPRAGPKRMVEALKYDAIVKVTETGSGSAS